MQGPNEQAEVARDMSIFNGCLSCYAIRRMKKCTENFIAKADPQTAFLAFFELRCAHARSKSSSFGLFAPAGCVAAAVAHPSAPTHMARPPFRLNAAPRGGKGAATPCQ